MANAFRVDKACVQVGVSAVGWASSVRAGRVRRVGVWGCPHPLCPPDKGTGVRYEISGASAPFCPSPPLPPSPASGRGGNLSLGEPPCAPTPLSHPGGEGRGVRAKKRAHLAHSELKRCTLTSCVPLSRKRARGKPVVGRTAVRLYTPRPPCGRGAGGEGLKQVSPPSRLAGVWCAVVEAGQSGASRRPAPAARARGRAIRGTR